MLFSIVLVFEGNRAEIGGAIFVEKFSNITIIDTIFCTELCNLPP